MPRGQGATGGGRDHDNAANLPLPTGGDFPHPCGQQSQEKHSAVSRERVAGIGDDQRGSLSRKKITAPYWELRRSVRRL
ncbi:hypothetical protein NDU88_003158 [Pleurodeles waltl]|uniref:Uncharacterized protein n=1 Tax=Pleurodeles waltl TaxID=8319 RepID=A0AAV7NNY5_PLEWA|nr:hypothetical protein NDU88_003158 [Pleurodeles waltl]